MYSGNKFIAMTGNALQPCEIAPKQDAITAFYKKYSTDAQKPKCQNYAKNAACERVIRSGVSTADEIVKRASEGKNGAEFDTLYRTGVHNFKKADGTPDTSKADFRLICLLVYYGASDSQIHQIFGASALGQRKKATPKYIQLTIDNARKTQEPRPQHEKKTRKYHH